MRDSHLFVTTQRLCPFPVEGGGESLMGPGGGGPGGGGCGTGRRYTAVRLGYAINGRTVTYAHDEEWCWDGSAACEVQGSYKTTWAREFRYDGARARYMNRPLNPTTLAPHLTKPTVWTDYDGAETYRDYTVSAGAVVLGDAFQPGLWRNLGGVSAYLHNDHLGTLRNTSDLGADPGTARVFTAFGEPITGSTDRHGYVGAWGYQSHPEEPTFPFLHVGARYYDPSTGRFLQRDPIGIRGDSNVFAYVRSRPTRALDPSGLIDGLHGGRDGVAHPPIIPDPPKGPPPLESIEDMQDDLRDEQVLQVVVGVTIGVIGIIPGIPGVAAGAGAGLVSGCVAVIADSIAAIASLF